MNENGKSVSLPGDNPIRDQGDDVLERTVVAEAFARQVLELDASEGTTVGIFGPWGSGKTSFVNLARKTFKSKGVPVLDFNPWLFSGIYIVSCDRLRVEQALGEQGLPGRDYLEKIIQWSRNLPEVPDHLLKEQLLQAIESALAGIQNPGPFDEDVWGEVYRGILRPLIRNMRDVRRFAMAIRETVGGLEGQVAQTDVLALEAIRVFLPEVFRLLPGAIDGLTVTTRPFERELDRMMPQDLTDSSSAFNERRKARVDGLIEAADKDGEREAVQTAKEVVEAMIDRLFAAGARLRRMSIGDSESDANEDATKYLTECRVAHEHVLRMYLERVTGPDLLAFHDAERALARMTNRNGFDRFIHSLEPARWQDVVSNLCDLSDRFRPEHVEPGIVALLNLWPDMPERPSSSSVHGNDTRSIVRRTSYRLLHSLEDTVAVEAALRRILPEVTSLSSKVELVLLVGHRENSGHKLVSETVAHELENMLRHEIRAAPADGLAEERDPLRVLVFAKHYGWPTEEPFEIDDSPKLTFALLRSTRWETATASSGAVTVTLSPASGPETLVDLYGGKEVLETRINNLKAGFDTLKPWLDTRRIPLDEAEQLLDLADRYLSGSHPDED